MAQVGVDGANRVYRIAVVPGDGIGKEVVPEGLRVLEALGALVGKNIGKKGPGVISLPGLCKIKVVNKPPQAARKNVPNPFKPGEFRDIPAKPASRKVRVLPLKALKDMVK